MASNILFSFLKKKNHDVWKVGSCTLFEVLFWRKLINEPLSSRCNVSKEIIFSDLNPGQI